MHALPLRVFGASLRRTAFMPLRGAAGHAESLSAACYGSLIARHQSTSNSSAPGGADDHPHAANSADSTSSKPNENINEATKSASVSSSSASSPASAASHDDSPATSSEARSSPASHPDTQHSTTSVDGSAAGDTAAAGSTPSTPTTTNPAQTDASGKGEVTTPEPEPVRWVQPAYQDPDSLPIVDEKGEYIVSRVQWPTGEIAYRTPAPVDDKLAPRFGYNVVQVRKHVSWWKYNQKYPRLSLAYINIQVLFLLGLAWLVAFLTTEYRNVTEAMRTPGAMVGEHRGKGPATNQTQKVTFEKDEMSALMDKAQNNWYDGKAEANYVGSKEYKMKKIPRPKEFSADDFRKR